MNMLTDREHAEVLKYYGQTTTDKINKTLSEAEQRILRQVAEVWERVIEDEKKVEEHDGFISKIKRNFLGIVKG